MWIWGNGGHAKVVRRLALELGASIAATIDDADESRPWSDSYAGLYQGIIAIGNNSVRRKIANRLSHLRPLYATLVWDMDGDVADRYVAPGAVVLHGAFVQPGSIVASHAIVNTGATVDHDCCVKDYAHIAPGAHLCGNVNVGEGALVGAGSVVTPGVTIGPWLTIPAGSVVTRDVLNESDLASLRGRRNQGGG